jgi:hypothetical protein
MDNEYKKSKEKSVPSTSIGVKPLAEAEVIA